MHAVGERKWVPVLTVTSPVRYSLIMKGGLFFTIEYSDPLQQFTPSQESELTSLLPEDSSPLSGTTIQGKNTMIFAESYCIKTLG